MAIDKEKTLQAAQKAIEKKKYDLAIEEYRKLAAAERSDPRWLLKIGDTQQKKGDVLGAIGTYEEVAKFYSAQGFHLKAVAVYNTVRDLLSKQPATVQTKYAHVPVRLAELYEKLQLTSDALATWDMIADRFQKEGREREAVEVYKRIVSLDPSNPLAHLRLAEAFSRIKDNDGAIAEFAATAEQLTAQNRVDDALKVYERLLHHRQEPRYARPAAELYLARGGPNDGVAAIAKIQVCLKSDPKSVELIALLARGFVAIGQNDKAVTIYKEAARLAGEQQKTDLRKDIVKRLQHIAPQDDGVKALAYEVLQGGKPAQPMPPRDPRPDTQRQEAMRQEPPRERQVGAAPSWLTSQAEAQRRPEAQRRRSLPGTSWSPQLQDDVEMLEVEEEDDDAVEFEEREAAEELTDMNQPSVRTRGSRVAEVIANADAFRKVKLYAKALTTLRIGLELDPRSVPLRERIRDVLIETGETDQAIAEMVSLSAILIEDGDLQGAYDNLAWVLEAEPEHQQASQLMDQVQVLSGNAPAAAAVDDELLERVPMPVGTGEFDKLDDARCLTPRVQAGQGQTVCRPRPRRTRTRRGTASRGYAAPAVEQTARGRTPPVEDMGRTGESALPAYALEDEAPPPEIASDYATEPGTGSPSPEVEAVLEEADFYAAQGVFETARETIEDALRSSPNHPLLVEKLREIESLSRAKDEGVTYQGQLRGLDDRAFDIAASLDALDELGRPVPCRQSARRRPGRRRRGVRQVQARRRAADRPGRQRHPLRPRPSPTTR
ncbi:MAG: tetratricopeptide repeat protein [Myxococcales bacterium]|nr:tetratricopeptide repeat protein [Myxococcales bacterium]